MMRTFLDNLLQRWTEWRERREEARRGTEHLLARINAKWERS